MLGGDFEGRLERQIELEFLQEQVELGFRLGVAGEQQLAAVGGWQVHVDHLHGGKLFQHAARGQPRCESTQAARQSDVQAISQEGDEDVRLDARLELVKDRPDREVAFQILECLFHRDQQQIVAPQLGRVFLDKVGAQKVSAFAPSCLSQLLAIEPIAEGGAVCCHLDHHQARGCPIFCVSSSREALYMVEGITDMAQAIRDEVIEELLQGYSAPQDLLGEEGLFKQLKKKLLERALGAELSEHLGYEKGDPAGRGSGNSRNGHGSVRIFV